MHNYNNQLILSSPLDVKLYSSEKREIPRSVEFYSSVSYLLFYINI